MLIQKKKNNFHTGGCICFHKYLYTFSYHTNLMFTSNNIDKNKLSQIKNTVGIAHVNCKMKDAQLYEKST